MKYEIQYGKAEVAVYRTNGTPLVGVTPIPESPFTGRDNVLMAAEIEIQVHGQRFLESYTEGDNRAVVATDTMKNLIHVASASSPAPRSRAGWTTSAVCSSTTTRTWSGSRCSVPSSPSPRHHPGRRRRRVRGLRGPVRPRPERPLDRSLDWS